MIEDKLKEMGLTLPSTSKPAGSYIPLVKIHDLVFISGQIPFVNDQLRTGKLGKDLTIEEGYDCAKICALNALSVIKSELGSLDKIHRIIKVSGYVNCVDDFIDQPKVINGASDLFGKLFGDNGKHSRIAIGSNSLPLNSAVEIDFIFHKLTNYLK